MEKRNRNIMILSIVALVLVLVGVTYAYFSAQITGIESASTISLTAGRMSIVYTEGDENVTVSNIYPKEDAWVTKTFTLTGYNTTNEEMKYDIGLNVIVNEFANNYLTYDLKVLENTKGVPASEKSNIPINGTGKIKFGTGSFTNADGDKHTYELKIYFKDNGLDQNDAQGAAFNAKISVAEYMPKKGYVYKQNILSYKINYDNCINMYSTWEYSSEAQETICSGGTYSDGDWSESIKEDVDNNVEWLPYLIEGGAIENIEYSDPVIATSLIPGDKYVDGQYTYIYGKERYVSFGEEGAYTNYKNIDGWSVYLTDSSSTEPVTTELCTTINDIPITSMSYMFYDSQATSIDLSSFDTSNVTNMSGMFYGSQAANLDLSSLDMSNVTDATKMFVGQDSISLRNKDLTKLTNANNMFQGVKNIDLSGSSINSFNLFAESTDTNSNIYYNNYVESLNLSNANLSGIISMDNLFNLSNYQHSWAKLKSISFANSYAPDLTSMKYMFANTKLETIDLYNMQIPKVHILNSMFADSESTNVNLSGFGPKIDASANSMFGRSNIKNLNLKTFDTSHITNMSYMFADSQATTLDLSNFDTSNVTTMTGMFNGSQVTSLDLSSFDTSKVTSMIVMYASATNLKTIYVSDKYITNSLFEHSDGDGTTRMFENCTSLVGGAGTTYNANYVDKNYAHIDGGTSNPGYFTDIKDKPSS